MLRYLPSTTRVMRAVPNTVGDEVYSVNATFNLKGKHNTLVVVEKSTRSGTVSLEAPSDHG